MKATNNNLLIILTSVLVLTGLHLLAQDKSLPVDLEASCNVGYIAHTATYWKYGFIEYTHSDTPKRHIYLEQTVSAVGSYNDGQGDSESMNVSTVSDESPDYGGVTDYSTTGADDITWSNSSLALDFQGSTCLETYSTPDGTTSWLADSVLYGCGGGGILGWVGGSTMWDGASQFMPGSPNAILQQQSLASETFQSMEPAVDDYGNPILDANGNQTYIATSPMSQTVTYQLQNENTTRMLIDKVLGDLAGKTDSTGGNAEIFLQSDETALTLGNATYSITTSQLGNNQIYALYEQLTAWTNGVVYKHFKRVCPIISSNTAFSDTVDIQISSDPAFKVNGMELMAQVGTNDTTLALTAVQLWRIGDYDPSDNQNPCSACQQCGFHPEPGMPVWRVSEPAINLHVSDTPVSYKTSLGQTMTFSVDYDQRDPRMSNTLVPITGWNNSWSSSVHIFGGVDSTGLVDFSKWTGYLYMTGGGVSVYDYTNEIDPSSLDRLTPLNNSSPVGNGTNFGANGFRLTHNDGSEDVYGIVTPVYSTSDQNGLNAVDHLVEAGELPTGLSVIPYLTKLNKLNGGWSYNIPFGEEDDDTNNASGSGVINGGANGGSGNGSIGSSGSKDWWPTIVTSFPAYTNEADALLTEHIDRFGNPTHFYYTTIVNSVGATNYFLQYVVDCDNKTNTIIYNNSQISSVTTPYGQTASFSYSGSQLASITDAQGMTSSFNYDTGTGWLNMMTTPYGTTHFTIWDAGSMYQNGFEYGTAQGTDTVSRAILVTRPDNSRDLYAYRYDDSSGNDVVMPSLPSPASAAPIPPIGTIDDGSTESSDSDASLNLRNSYHWGPQQCALLSTTSDPNQLVAQDYLLANMSHWLAGRYAGAEAGGTISFIRQASPDGRNPGAVTWFDYAGKATPYQLGQAPMTEELEAQVLPDSSTRYTDVKYNSGIPASITSTYSLPDGSVGTRTTTADFTNVMIGQTFTAGTNLVSQGYWVFPELLDITGPQGESQLYLSRPYSTQTVTETNSGVTSTLQIPNRLSLVAIDAISNVTMTLFNPRGQKTCRVAAGLTVTNFFDPNGFPAGSIALEIQRTNLYAFTNGQLAAATSPLGLISRYSWDNLGRLTGIGYPDNTCISNIYTRLDVTGRKDRLGNWQHAAYDSVRHQTNFTDRNGWSTTFTYCPCGGLESVTDPLNGTTTYDRDYNGQIIGISDVASGRTYGLTRNILGQVVNIADSADTSGDGFDYFYNNQGKLTDVTYNEGDDLYQVSYDIYDRPASVVDANGIEVDNTYDYVGHALTRAYPNGGVERNFYSALGLVKHYDLNQQPTFYGYDPAGRLTSVTNANLQVTSYGYDPAGDLVTLTDGRTNTTTWAYDQYRQVIAKTDANHVVVWTNSYNANGWLANTWTPAKGLTTVSHDLNGNVTSITMPGISMNRVYDALNRATQIDDGNIRLKFAYTSFGAFKGALSSESSQTIAPSLDPNDTLRGVAYGYNNELLSSQTRSDQTVYYSYDALGRLLTVNNAEGAFVYTYNGNGNLVQSLEYPTGSTSLESYDPIGEVTNINISAYNEQDSVSYDYSLTGNRLHLWRAKNMFAGNDSSVSYGYDAIGQLTGALGYESNGVPRLNEKFGYGYDNAGNLVARTNGALVQVFVPDPANELTNVTRNSSLTFDGNASTNLASVTVNGQSTVIYSDQTFATTSGLSLSSGTNTFTVVSADVAGDVVTNRYAANLPPVSRLQYDLNGNLVSDGVRGFDYDGLNELIRVTTTNVWKTEYDYDGLLRHHARREFAWLGSSWLLVNECYYVYAGNDVVQEVNTTEGTASYTYGLGLLERDSTVTSQPTVFYQADANGNVNLLFDIYQQVQARYTYDPYGNLLAKSGPMADVNRYRFSGKEFNQHTGLYYFGYRFYEPNLQRWLNRDPLGEAGGINLYDYVGNNPVNWIDPLGLAVYPNNFVGPLPPGSVYQYQADAWIQQAEGHGISDLSADFFDVATLGSGMFARNAIENAALKQCSKRAAEAAAAKAAKDAAIRELKQRLEHFENELKFFYEQKDGAMHYIAQAKNAGRSYNDVTGVTQELRAAKEGIDSSIGQINQIQEQLNKLAN